MDSIKENIKYKFIPNKVVSFTNIIKIEKVLENNSFEKYIAKTEVEGELIICNDISKIKDESRKIYQETYEEYLEFISKRDIEIDRWIYNIIDGISEQDSIVFRDESIIIIPTYEWNGENINKLHLLCLPVDKNIRSLRDLRQKHIPLLEYMKKITLMKINELYNLTENDLKIFIHYEPSTYHLHIHFVNINFRECNSSVEYSHDINMVIFNLKIDNNYYQKIKLNKEILNF
jgi:m7GpppX diphosphatase